MPLKESQKLVTFGDHRHFGSEDIMLLIFHLTKVSKILLDESEEGNDESEVTKPNDGDISRLSNGDTFRKYIND